MEDLGMLLQTEYPYSKHPKKKKKKKKGPPGTCKNGPPNGPARKALKCRHSAGKYRSPCISDFL
jgi:hypothetical protein